jgi:hypothetical protein
LADNLSLRQTAVIDLQCDIEVWTNGELQGIFRAGRDTLLTKCAFATTEIDLGVVA